MEGPDFINFFRFVSTQTENNAVIMSQQYYSPSEIISDLVCSFFGYTKGKEFNLFLFTVLEISRR